MKKWGNILLGAWLIVTGLISLAGLSFSGSYTIQALLAVAAGALLILADWKVQLSGRVADIVLGIWLVVMGLIRSLTSASAKATLCLACCAGSGSAGSHPPLNGWHQEFGWQG
jgi:hypothetical protein